MFIVCAWCKCEKEIPDKEYRRQIRRGRLPDRFFCGLSCGAKFSRRCQYEPLPDIRVCLYCGQEFRVVDNRLPNRFCSRSCASAGSVTDYRREKASQIGKTSTNLISVDETLKRREAWKYEKIAEFLSKEQIIHEFEFFLDGYVFDLAIPCLGILIEFDGIYHEWATQKEVDIKKERVAEAYGWRLFRIPEAGVIDPSSLVILPGFDSHTLHQLEKETMMAVLNCDCKHPYQDLVYGKGRRWHNPLKDTAKGYRCSVCSKTRTS
jgi:very-short-patch-repair endonuclease